MEKVFIHGQSERLTLTQGSIRAFSEEPDLRNVCVALRYAAQTNMCRVSFLLHRLAHTPTAFYLYILGIFNGLSLGRVSSRSQCIYGMAVHPLEADFSCNRRDDCQPIVWVSKTTSVGCDNLRVMY